MSLYTTLSHRLTRSRRQLQSFALALALGCGLMNSAHSSDFVIYSIYQGLNLGNPGEVTYKDFYVNMGSSNGVGPGSLLEVMRIIATYDVNNQKLYKDMIFPIGTLRVIHAENNAAIARIEKIYPADQTPAFMPRALMVGDRVRVRRP